MCRLMVKWPKYTLDAATSFYLQGADKTNLTKTAGFQKRR